MNAYVLVIFIVKEKEKKKKEKKKEKKKKILLMSTETSDLQKSYECVNTFLSFATIFFSYFR
jgi:hypothetical protein